MKLILGQLIPGFAVIAFCCGLFAIGGGLVAVGLNWLVPGYYPGVYPSNMELYAGTYAIAPAAGQGLLMGLGVGVILTVGLGSLRQLDLAPIARALRLVAIFGLLFGTAGLGIGYGAGRVNPNYYERLFDSGRRPHSDFRPVDVGIGLGCAEGLMIGLISGAVAAVVTVWHRSRRLQPTVAAFDQHPYDRPMPPEPW